MGTILTKQPNTLDSNKPIVTLFLFWVPLAMTWLMMAVEGPMLAALIARCADTKYNLAAYGIAFSFALIIEAPIILIMSASTALVQDAASYKKLFKFTSALNAIITGIMLFFVIPSVFYFITLNLMQLPREIATLAHWSTIFLIPWPAAIGFRRFYQGILIRNNKTRRVAYGTIVRLSTISITAFTLYFTKKISGTYIATISLSVGVCMEAIASRIMVHSTLHSLLNEKTTEPASDLTYKKIINFYTPLALTSMITLGINPIITFFMAQSRMAIESLAVLPVINSFLFLFRASGLSYQEVVITYISSNKNQYPSIRMFAVIIAFVTTALLCIISFSPLIHFWYTTVSGLSLELSQFAVSPTRILFLWPAIEVWLALQRGLLVSFNNTGIVTWAIVLESVIILLVLFAGIHWFSLIGIFAATAALLFGKIVGTIFLIPYQNRSLTTALQE